MYYIMSDIHGCYSQMEDALKQWDQEKEHLIIMGDLIDRGPDSLKVVEKLMELKNEFPDNITILKGNHEEMLLSWLNTPKELLAYYYNEAHSETLKSFMGEKRYKKSTRQQRALDLIYNNKKELRFMDSLQLYMETENIIFVHAGINLNVENWFEREQDLLWIRNDFIYSKKTPEKRVFFGHTPTALIHGGEHKNFDIWISPDEMKVGIDGGVSMGGQLNALKVDTHGNIIEKLRFC